jgi:hypothetical protein
MYAGRQTPVQTMTEKSRKPDNDFADRRRRRWWWPVPMGFSQYTAEERPVLRARIDRWQMVVGCVLLLTVAACLIAVWLTQ